MYTKEELTTQLKRALSTAETFHEKGNRNWAYAKNDKGGHYYAIARDAYAKEKTWREKAAVYQKMLESGNYAGSVKAVSIERSFTGGSLTVKRPSAMCKSVACGAAVFAALAMVDGVMNGDRAEEVTQSAVSSAAAGGAAGFASNVVGTSASFVIGEVTRNSALVGTFAGQAIPVAGAAAASIAAGQLAMVAAKPFIENTVDGILNGYPVEGIEAGLVESSLAVDDFIDEVTGSVRDGVCDFLESAMDSFCGWLDLL